MHEPIKINTVDERYRFQLALSRIIKLFTLHLDACRLVFFFAFLFVGRNRNGVSNDLEKIEIQCANDGAHIHSTCG